MSTQTSYSWLKHLPRDILNLAPASMYGNPPPFDLAAFSKELSQALETPVEVKYSLPEPKEAAKLKEGFSDENLQTLSFKLAPLKGFFHILLAKDIFKDLVKKDLPKDYPLDAALIDAFKEFAIASSITAFQKGHPDKTLIPQFSVTPSLNEANHLAIELEIALLGMKFPGRLLIDQDLIDAWREKFKSTMPSQQFLNELYLDIHVEAGRVALSRADFKSLESGDFLILD